MRLSAFTWIHINRKIIWLKVSNRKIIMLSLGKIADLQSDIQCCLSLDERFSLQICQTQITLPSPSVCVCVLVSVCELVLMLRLAIYLTECKYSSQSQYSWTSLDFKKIKMSVIVTLWYEILQQRTEILLLLFELLVVMIIIADLPSQLIFIFNAMQ